jgi:hypothetical protein
VEAVAWIKNLTGELVSVFHSQYQKCLEERCKLGDFLSGDERQERASKIHFDFRRNNEEELERLAKIIPIEPSTAVYINERYGKEKLLKLDFNLTLADSELGPGWLDKYDGLKSHGVRYANEIDDADDWAREETRLRKLAFMLY